MPERETLTGGIGFAPEEVIFAGDLGREHAARGEGCGGSSREVRPGRPEFRGAAAFNLTLGLTAGVRLGPRWGAIATVSAERLAKEEIGDSPVVDRDYGYFALAGVTYRFTPDSATRTQR